MCTCTAEKHSQGVHENVLRNSLEGVDQTRIHDGPHGRQTDLQPKFEKKVTIDRSARDAGYRIIRENGPKSNNRLGSVSPDPWSILVFGPSCPVCSVADCAPVGAPTCSKPCKQILVSWASAFLSGSAAAALHSAMICWIADEQRQEALLKT